MRLTSTAYQQIQSWLCSKEPFCIGVAGRRNLTKKDDRHPYKYSVQFSLCMHGKQNEMFGGLGILSKANPWIYIVTPDIITIFPSEAGDSHISRWHAKCDKKGNAWRSRQSEYTNWRTTHACIMKGEKKILVFENCPFYAQILLLAV